MATVNVLERDVRVETLEKGINPKLAQEMEDILQEAAQTSEKGQAEKVRLVYRVPFAGARYYF